MVYLDLKPASTVRRETGRNVNGFQLSAPNIRCSRNCGTLFSKKSSRLMKTMSNRHRNILRALPILVD